MNKETWERRGHVRKPNFIVLSLYWIFDMILDFVPMFSTLFKFLGRSSLVLVNLVILVGIIVMSSAHSLELLRYAGAKGGLEWVGLIIWEAIFIFSSILLDKDFKNGNWKSVSWPWIGFILGFAFVEISNVMGMAKNWIGIAIGISTPVMLLVSKGLLAHQFKTEKALKNTESDTEIIQDEIPTDIQEEIQKEVTENTTENIKINTEKNTEAIDEIAEQNTESNTTENTPEKIGGTTKENKPVKDEKEKTSSRPKHTRTKDSTAKKKTIKKKNINKDITEILEVAKRLKQEDKLSRPSLEKEANTTTHYARKALAELEELEAKNTEENPRENTEKNPEEKPKLELVK